MPLPKDETTPPVIKMNLVMRCLTLGWGNGREDTVPERALRLNGEVAGSAFAGTTNLIFLTSETVEYHPLRSIIEGRFTQNNDKTRWPGKAGLY